MIALSFAACGGGSGSSSSPPAQNPGVPSLVELTSSHNVAQTNSSIVFHAKVLDRNGVPVANENVTFTNLSEDFGVVVSGLRALGIIEPKVSFGVNPVKTNGSGIATVNVSSTTEGFATIQAEVGSGIGFVRDSKTVFFTSVFPFPAAPPPTLTLDVDDGDGIFSEPDDFILFKTTTDNQRVIRATVMDGFGLPVFKTEVTFGADRPFKTSTDGDCSDGSDTCEVVFPQGNTAITDQSGQASVIVQVNHSADITITTVLNITASAVVDGVDAFNLVTLFLNPVPPLVIDPAASSVTAFPDVVNVNGTSAITAIVGVDGGGFAPDGTSVNLRATCGSVDPFAQTTNGVATATFTAPPFVPASGICTVTGNVGGVEIGSADITITTALAVFPASQTVSSVTGGTVTYLIFGGISPYTITPSNSSFPAELAEDGKSFTVTVPANSTPGTVTYTVRDAAGTTVTATLVIGAGPALSVVPSAQTVNGAPGGAATFTIFGGIPPYTVTPNNSDPIFAADPALVEASGDTFTVTVPANTPATTVAYTIRDSVGTLVTATLNITFLNTDFFVLPAAATIPAGGSVTMQIFGGIGPFDLFVDRPVDAAVFFGGPRDFTVVGINPATVTITVRDTAPASNGRTTTATVTVQ